MGERGWERKCTYCVIKTGAKERGKWGRTSSRPLSTLHLASGESCNLLRPRATSSSGEGGRGERLHFRGNYDDTERGRGSGDILSLSLEIYLSFLRRNLSFVSLSLSLRFVFFAWTGFSRLMNARISRKLALLSVHVRSLVVRHLCDAAC